MMSNVQSPVTLIVKAPNQQIEDQTIECELQWSVRRLKERLSEVYPNKPRTEEQRLIYSGHLLNDSSTLGEVLRTADGQKHTLHLVCAHNAHTQTQTPSPVPDGVRRRAVESNNTSNRPSVASSTDPGARESTSTPSVHTSASMISSSSSTDARLSGNAFFAGAFMPPTPPVSPTVHSPPGSPLDTPIEQAADLQNMQSQYMAYMQQAYAQYMMQYMQFMVANGGQTGLGVQWPTSSSVGAAPTNSATATAPSETDRQQANAAAAQREPAARVEENGDNDDLGNRRDWLEWMYFVFRVVVLFMLVYAYSSPLRFAVVSILGICVYLYQRGYFRLPPDPNYPNVGRVPDNNNEPNVVDAAERAGIRHRNADGRATPAADRIQGAVRPVPAGGTSSPDPSAVNAGNPLARADQARPSIFALTWAFFTCFFTSIIPERPVIP